MTRASVLLLLFVAQASSVEFHYQQQASGTKGAQAAIAEFQRLGTQILVKERRKAEIDKDIELLPDQKDIRKRQVDAEIAELQVQRVEAANRAIQATIVEYGIAPNRDNVPLVTGGPFVGKRASWRPTFGDLSPRRVVGSDGKSHVLKLPQAWASATWADGRVELTQKVFSSVQFLAAAIIHETVHFEQRTTSGRGDRMTYQEAELDAHWVMISNKSVIGLSSDEVARIEESLKTSTRPGPRGTIDGTPFVGTNESKDERGYDPLVKSYIDAAAAVNQERERLRVLQDGRRVAPPARLDSPAQAAVLDPVPGQRERNAKEQIQWLRYLAGDICANPARLQQYNFPGGIGEHWDKLRGDLRWLRSRGETVAISEESVFEGLPKCEYALLKEMTRRMEDGRWMDILQDREARYAAEDLCRSINAPPPAEAPVCHFMCQGQNASSSDSREVGRLGPSYYQLKGWPH